MTRRRLAVAIAACLTACCPSAAVAHTGIERLSPRAGAVKGTGLAAVRVTFTARVGDANLTVRRGSTVVSRGTGRLVHGRRAVRVRLRGALSAGAFRATVRWLSGDGHVQDRSWSFRLR